MKEPVFSFIWLAENEQKKREKLSVRLRESMCDSNKNASNLSQFKIVFAKYFV